MKRNITKLFGTVLPLTIISMFIITKWWYVLPIDGTDKMYWGFPFAFMGEGFHTSMSLQFFTIVFLADFAIYFSIILVLVLVFLKWLPTNKTHKIFTKTVWVLTLFLLIGFGFIVTTSNPIFHTKRNYNWHVLTTGHVWIWQSTPRPNFYLNKKK